MMAIYDASKSGQELKHRVRRNALWLLALALTFYAGFIFLSVRSSFG